MLRLTNINKEATVLITIPLTRETIKLKANCSIDLRNLTQQEVEFLRTAYRSLGVYGTIIPEKKREVKQEVKAEEKKVETSVDTTEVKQEAPKKKSQPKRSKITL